MSIILAKVSDAFAIDLVRLVAAGSGWSDMEAARARMAAFAIARDRINISYFKIGKLIGNRNHATVIHGIKRCRELLETDPDFAARYEKARG